ncbi:helix-turn-helix domain-containing protein [Escherichia coli]|nr:helix-turn-helix domain-containing protein [Escherichia coli]
MAKPKYFLETRLAAVNHYLAGHDGARRTVERFGVEETSVRRWVRSDTGEEELLNIKPGRSKDMTKPQKTPPINRCRTGESYLPKNCGWNSVTFAQRMSV